MVLLVSFHAFQPVTVLAEFSDKVQKVDIGKWSEISNVIIPLGLTICYIICEVTIHMI